VYAVAATLQQRPTRPSSSLVAEQWASVVVDGQPQSSAQAPTESDRQERHRRRARGGMVGGKWIGGITVVKNAMTLAKALSPYEWAAQLGDRGRVRLSGYVPGQKHRRTIRAEAQRLFPPGIEDQNGGGAGAPTGHGPTPRSGRWRSCRVCRR